MLLGWIAGTMAVTDPAVVRLPADDCRRRAPTCRPTCWPTVRYGAGVAGALLVLAIGLVRQAPPAPPRQVATTASRRTRRGQRTPPAREAPGWTAPHGRSCRRWLARPGGNGRADRLGRAAAVAQANCRAAREMALPAVRPRARCAAVPRLRRRDAGSGADAMRYRIAYRPIGARPRLDGCGAPGRGQAQRQAGGAEDAAAGRGRRGLRRGGGAFSGRSRGRAAAVAPGHRRGLRRRPERRHRLARDGAAARLRPAALHARRRGCCREPHRRRTIERGRARARACAPPRRRAPRHQAGQRDARPGPRGTVKLTDFGIAQPGRCAAHAHRRRARARRRTWRPSSWPARCATRAATCTRSACSLFQLLSRRGCRTSARRWANCCARSRASRRRTCAAVVPGVTAGAGAALVARALNRQARRTLSRDCAQLADVAGRRNAATIRGRVRVKLHARQPQVHGLSDAQSRASPNRRAPPAVSP